MVLKEKAIKSSPSSEKFTLIYFDKVAALEEIFEYGNLLECQNQIISLDPVNSMAYFHKGKILDAMFNYQDAYNTNLMIIIYSQKRKSSSLDSYNKHIAKNIATGRARGSVLLL